MISQSEHDEVAASAMADRKGFEKACDLKADGTLAMLLVWAGAGLPLPSPAPPARDPTGPGG